MVLTIGHDLCCPVCRRTETGNIWKLPHEQENFCLWSKCVLTNPAFLCKIIPVIVGHKKPSPLLQQRGRCKAIACTLIMRLKQHLSKDILPYEIWLCQAGFSQCYIKQVIPIASALPDRVPVVKHRVGVQHVRTRTARRGPSKEEALHGCKN